MKTKFLLFFALLSSLAPALAQKNKDEITVRLTAQALPDFFQEARLVTANSEGEAFALPTRNFTPAIPVAERAFVIRSVSRPDAGIPVQLPPAGNHFVILLLKNEQGGLTPRIIDGSTPGFRPGDIYLQNLTKKELVGTIGSRQFSVPPGKAEVVRPAGARDGILDVAIGFLTTRGVRPVTTSRWPEDPAHRAYLLFTENAAGTRVQFRSIEEFVNPAP